MSERQGDSASACHPAQGGVMRYIGAIVLGMNDALVEMTGALAGFTMALPNNRLVALAGFITGVAATLSMAAAEFLSQETAASGKRPLARRSCHRHCLPDHCGASAAPLLPVRPSGACSGTLPAHRRPDHPRLHRSDFKDPSYIIQARFPANAPHQLRNCCNRVFHKLARKNLVGY